MGEYDVGMKSVYLVKQEEADLARAMERKLLALPRSSGVLFVGVSVRPRTSQSSPVYDIFIGCDRDLDEKLMDPLVRVTLRDALEEGIQVVISARRGVGRDDVDMLFGTASS